MKEKRKASGIQLLIRSIVKDPDGNVVSDSGDRPARSFTLQFLEFIQAMFTGVTKDATTIDNAEEKIWYNIGDIFSWGFLASTYFDDVGIVVGTGDTAPTNTDYKLETRLTHGVGAGDISHGTMDIGSAAEVGPNVDLPLRRAFTNLTGSSIVVKEAGIYLRNVSFIHCIARDLVVGGTLPNLYSLTIIYTVRTTV